MIEHAGSSDMGPVRSNNEDYIAHCSPSEPDVRLSKGHLFVVADGVGGSRAGEVASKEAATTLVSSYFESSRQAGRALQDSFKAANLHVYDLGQTRPEYQRMQTTLSALALIGDQAYVGHVGDTRIYLVRGSEAQQLTRDHSEVGELVRMKLLTADEARHHPRRSVITRAIGTEPIVQAEFRSVEVQLGDIFVICTDGMWEPVEDQDFADVVSSHTAEESCRRLTELAIERGTTDNLSIQVVKVVKWERDPTAGPARSQSLWERAMQMIGKSPRKA